MMIEMKKGLTVAATLAACMLTLAGCSAQAADESPETTEPSAPLPPFSAEGLALESSGPDHVSGRFEREGTAIVFALDRDRAHDVRHIVVRRPSGEEVFESTLTAGVDDSRYLGGKASVEDFAKIPEASVVAQIKGALEAAGIDPSLYRAPVATGDLAPRVIESWNTSPNQNVFPDNIWRWVNKGSSIRFLGWATFWNALTEVHVLGPHRLTVWTSAGTETMTSSAPYSVYRRYWAGWVTIANPIQLCGTGQTCFSSSAGILVR